MENTATDQAPVTEEITETSEMDTHEAEAPLVDEGEPTEPEEEEVGAQEPEVVEFAGRSFNDLSEAEKTYKEMQQRATRAEQQLKEVERQQKIQDEKAKLADMTPEQKLDYLANQQAERMFAQQEAETLQGEVNQFEKAQSEVEAFVKKHPELNDYGLTEIFQDIALREDMMEYTLDSIYNVKIKPMLTKLAGTKVTRKKRSVSKAPQETTPQLKDVASMSPAEYEKHREAVLAQAGIRYKK